MTAKDDFSARLRAAMKAAGMKVSATELERAFNLKWNGRPVSVQAAANWINGANHPSKDKLQVLAAMLKVDPQTLLYGSPKPLSAQERRREWEDRLTYAERETIDAFLRLPTQYRLLAREVINAFAKAHGAAEPGRE